MPNSPELKPCAHCGSRDIHTGRYDASGVIFCRDCGISVDKPSFQEALKSWQARKPEGLVNPLNDQEGEVKELADIIIKVAMGHHNDVSQSDDNNAMECAEEILKLGYTRRSELEVDWEVRFDKQFEKTSMADYHKTRVKMFIRNLLTANGGENK